VIPTGLVPVKKPWPPFSAGPKRPLPSPKTSVIYRLLR
jgi:hypothetical protein